MMSNNEQDKAATSLPPPPPPPEREPIKTLPRRFYKQASVSPERGILLDGREVKTPLKNALRLPNEKLAQAVAEEWNSQKDFINLPAMTLTKLANTAQDKAELEREKMLDEIAAYALSDMVLHRVSEPPKLVARQEELWDPVLNWANQELGPHFAKTESLHDRPDQRSQAAMRRHITKLDPYRLTALHALTTLTGSSLISLMLLEGKITPEQAWEAANLEEDWQIAHWGQDKEATIRREQRQREFQAIVNFLAAL